MINKMKNKKRIYILAAMFLGFLLSMIAHAKIEIWHIQRTLDAGMVPASYGRQEFLHPLASVALLAIGLSFGYVVGQRWWQIVYVEKRHWSFRKNKAK